MELTLYLGRDGGGWGVLRNTCGPLVMAAQSDLTKWSCVHGRVGVQRQDMGMGWLQQDRSFTHKHARPAAWVAV